MGLNKMKNFVRIEGNILRKIEPFLVNMLKAKRVDVVSDNISTAYYTYEVEKDQEKSEVILQLEEDIFGDVTTTITASGEVLKQINDFIEGH